MRAVMGIDAAWSLKNPSGVALACEQPAGWTLMAVEASYQRFHACADDLPKELRPSGSCPDAAALLASAAKLGGCRVNLVAIDMPLAHAPIIGRRVCDNDVSREYGARKCATHTPSAVWPGRLSDALREGLHMEGYGLLTRPARPNGCGVVEVYPHPALVELANASMRLPYKHAKRARYWPSATKDERRRLLFEQWREIVRLLDAQIAGVAVALPLPPMNASGVELKAFEDALDAVVCAWVGICVLDGRARAYGDAHSAIWIPTAVVPDARP
jgi:predicted RNase H-like nuclease